MAHRPQSARHCLNCGLEFTPARSWQRFCKPECRTDNWNQVGRFEVEKLRKEVADLRAENSSLKQHIEFGRKLPT